MAKSRANLLMLLSTMRMVKLYQSGLFRRLFEKESLWVVIENTQLPTSNAHNTARGFPI